MRALHRQVHLRPTVRWVDRSDADPVAERILEDSASCRRFVVSRSEVPLVDALLAGTTEEEIIHLLTTCRVSCGCSEYIALFEAECLLDDDATRAIANLRSNVQWELSDALLATLRETAMEIPYYRDLFSTLTNGPPESIEDLCARTPLLRRGTYLSGFPERFVPEGRSFADLASSSSNATLTTSGTTGRRIVLLHDRSYLRSVFQSTFLFEDIFQSTHAIFGPPNCTGIGCTAGPRSFAERHAGGVLIVDARYVMHQSAQQAMERLKEIERAAVDTVIADPYYLAQTAHVALECGYELPRLAVIYLSYTYAEVTTRAFLEEAFGCRVGDLYGLAEGGFQLMRSCPRGGIHLNEEFFLFEFISGSYGKSRRLVFSSVKSPLIPFIRYETSDLFELHAGNAYCRCGSPYRTVKHFDGRIEHVISARGALVPFGTIDRTLGAVKGMLMYQLEVSDEAATLTYVGDVTEAEVVEIAEDRWKHSCLQSHRVRAKRSRLIDVLPTGKFSPVRVWYAQ
jgi:phenylacetate-coenzyme A ligase PaaK-like adenylate-forming protein